MREQKKLPLAVKILVIFVIVNILIWIIFCGGCLNGERIKLFHNIKIDMAVMYITLLVAMSILYLIQHILKNKRRLLFNAQFIAVSSQLLI